MPDVTVTVSSYVALTSTGVAHDVYIYTHGTVNLGPYATVGIFHLLSHDPTIILKPFSPTKSEIHQQQKSLFICFPSCMHIMIVHGVLVHARVMEHRSRGNLTIYVLTEQALYGWPQTKELEILMPVANLHS